MTARVLYIHGLNAAPADWGRLADELADIGEASTATLLGHGGRPRAPRYAVADFAVDLPPGPSGLVVAHSLGAAAAAVRAAAEPDWTRALVLLDPVLLVADEHVEAIAADQEAELSLTRDELTAAKPGWHPADVDAKLAGIAAVVPEVSRRAFTDTAALGGWDVTAATLALRIPTLVVQGDPSVFTLLQPEVADRIRRANPDVTIAVVRGTGHAPHRDDLPATARTIRSWWKGVVLG